MFRGSLQAQVTYRLPAPEYSADARLPHCVPANDQTNERSGVTWKHRTWVFGDSPLRVGRRGDLDGTPDALNLV